MVFSSLLFLMCFLPIVFFLYFLVPRHLKHVVLLLASFLFYGWGEPIYVFLMIFSTVFNYYMGKDIGECKEKFLSAKFTFWFTIAINLLILGFFKYYGFLIQVINEVFHTKFVGHQLALPIGISFYTFQTLSYIVDVYWGKVKVQKSYINFALYVSMFPQLVAGPIVNYIDIEEQLNNHKVTMEEFGQGSRRFLVGLGKKVLFANQLGLLWEQINGMATGERTVLLAWIGIIAYTLQIYFDFSGYSDMAIGLGHLFGFTYKENFRYPYLSTSVTEFWRRWHISLGSWFREYVYIPLGGNRCKTLRWLFNLLVVWFLTGLWHGASWNFIIWGLYYGALLIIEKFLAKGFFEKLPKIIRYLYTMFAVMMGWVLFASNGFLMALQYFKTLFGIDGSGLIDQNSLFLLQNNSILLLLGIIGMTPLVSQLGKCFYKKAAYWKAAIFFLLETGYIIVVLSYLVTETYNPFLYFRF